LELASKVATKVAAKVATAKVAIAKVATVGLTLQHQTTVPFQLLLKFTNDQQQK
jgi:hypothetical protein